MEEPDLGKGKFGGQVWGMDIRVRASVDFEMGVKKWMIPLTEKGRGTIGGYERAGAKFRIWAFKG